MRIVGFITLVIALMIVLCWTAGAQAQTLERAGGLPPWRLAGPLPLPETVTCGGGSHGFTITIDGKSKTYWLLEDGTFEKAKDGDGTVFLGDKYVVWVDKDGIVTDVKECSHAP